MNTFIKTAPLWPPYLIKIILWKKYWNSNDSCNITYICVLCFSNEVPVFKNGIWCRMSVMQGLAHNPTLHSGHCPCCCFIFCGTQTTLNHFPSKRLSSTSCGVRSRCLPLLYLVPDQCKSELLVWLLWGRKRTKDDKSVLKSWFSSVLVIWKYINLSIWWNMFCCIVFLWKATQVFVSTSNLPSVSFSFLLLSLHSK